MTNETYRKILHWVSFYSDPLKKYYEPVIINNNNNEHSFYGCNITYLYYFTYCRTILLHLVLFSKL